MKKRNRARGRRNNQSGLNIGRPARRQRKSWTFEQLEARMVFSTTPLTDIPWQTASNDTTDGAQVVAERDLFWNTLESAGIHDTGIAVAPQSLPNDPLLNDQWHLINTGQFVGTPLYQPIKATPGQDVDVAPAWDMGITGKGVVIGVIDTGVQISHPDLVNNIDSGLSFDFITGQPTGGPGGSTPNDAHGTAVAGIIAAQGNNGVGMAGIAYDAKIASLRLLSGNAEGTNVTDLQLAQALSFHNQDIDIYNLSLGPVRTPNDPTVPNPRQTVALGQNSALALFNAALFGRGGLGSVIVVAAGNDAGPQFSPGFADIGVWASAEASQLVNSRYTIGVTVADQDGGYNNLYDGTVTAYPEAGPAVLVAAPSATDNIDVVDNSFAGSGIWTTDLTGDGGYNRAPQFGLQTDGDYLDNTDYTSRFGGTSAAAPMVSGVIALMLQANPNLSFRDIEEILVRSSRQNVPDEVPQTGQSSIFSNFDSWITNSNQLFRDPDPYDTTNPPMDVAPLVFDPLPTAANPPSPFQFTNGAGYTVSGGRGAYGEEHGYGHGVVDAGLAVTMAKEWSTLGQGVGTFLNEKTFTTFVEQVNFNLPAREKANDDAGDLLIPGEIGGLSGFAAYWNEYFKDATDPMNGPFTEDNPPQDTRGSYLTIPIPDSQVQAVEWADVKLSINGAANAMDYVRVTLVSPDGTISDMTNNFRLNGSEGTFSLQYPDNSVFVNDPAGTLQPTDQFVWTYTSNRSWGERTDPQLVIDPVSGEPFLSAGQPVKRGWELHIENWSTTALVLNAFEVAFHGKALTAGTQRVQGFVGIDAGANGVGSQDHKFNFNRYIQNDATQSGRVGFLEESVGSSNGFTDTQDMFRYADPNQEPFASNVVVKATRDSDGSVAGRFLVGADGNFYFDLVPDNYTLTVENPLGGGLNLEDQSGVPANVLPDYKSVWHITKDWFHAPDRNTGSNGLPGTIMYDPVKGAPVPFNATKSVLTSVKGINFLIDPGPAPAAQITVSGKVYTDVNGNGTFDGDDTPLGGVTVYADLNSNGQFDSTDLFVTTSSSDDPNVRGTYTLTVPETAKARVFVGAVLPAPDWTFINPAATPDNPNALTSVFGGPGSAFTAVDFGIQPPATSNPGGPGHEPGTLLGIVYEDINGNGVRNAGDNGVPNIRVFIDANQNGSYDAGETFTFTAANGSYSFTSLPPAVYQIGIAQPSSYQLTQPSTGNYQVTLLSDGTITGLLFGLKNLATNDFGDLSGYPTTLAQDGARNFIIPGFQLGALVDGEVNGQPTADATGDDNSVFDDEDGVVLLTPGGKIRPGANTVQVTVSGVGGYLNTWMDFNGNGSWNDTGDKVFSNLHLNPGTYQLVFNAPEGLPAGGVAARFRWGNFGIGYTGADTIGEVEDYLFAATNIGPKTGDYNSDGVVNQGDYNVWLTTFGSTSDLRRDGNGNGAIDVGDYSIWRDHASSVGPGAGSGSTAGGASESGSGQSAAALDAGVAGSSVSSSAAVGTTNQAGLSAADIARMNSLGYSVSSLHVGSHWTQSLLGLTPSLTGSSSTSSPSAPASQDTIDFIDPRGKFVTACAVTVFGGRKHAGEHVGRAGILEGRRHTVDRRPVATRSGNGRFWQHERQPARR